MNSSLDSDYHLPSGCCTSEDDEEDAKINKKLMEFKKKLNSGELFSAHVTETDQLDGCDHLDGNSTPYAYSIDEDESFEEGPDGEVLRKEDNFPRFDKKAVVPKFVLGMKFSDKKLFKDAGNRVRAVCDWPMYPCVCLLKKTTSSESWFVTSLNDENTCPKRRDNKLVTSRKIADRFEELIKANLAWSLHHLQATVQ
jgi:alpha-galactosidase